MDCGHGAFHPPQQSSVYQFYCKQTSREKNSDRWEYSYTLLILHHAFISARVNLATCQVASGFIIILYFAFILRIIFGAFTYYGVVTYHYGTRLTFVSFITMITFNRVLKALFILDFQRISLIPEHRVMSSLCFVTVICSLIYLLQEAIVREIRGLNHFGGWSLSIYLGKVVFNYQIPLINKSIKRETLLKQSPAKVGLEISYCTLYLLSSSLSFSWKWSGFSQGKPWSRSTITISLTALLMAVTTIFLQLSSSYLLYSLQLEVFWILWT